jgi:hypothetical protein
MRLSALAALRRDREQLPWDRLAIRMLNIIDAPVNLHEVK